MSKTISAFMAATVVAAGMMFITSVPLMAHYVPIPCDFITSGGYVFRDDGAMANFSADGGCKNGDFWGNINFVDHGTPVHLNATQITGYLWDPAVPNARDICGWARVNEDSS